MSSQCAYVCMCCHPFCPPNLCHGPPTTVYSLCRFGAALLAKCAQLDLISTAVQNDKELVQVYSAACCIVECARPCNALRPPARALRALSPAAPPGECCRSRPAAQRATCAASCRHGAINNEFNFKIPSPRNKHQSIPTESTSTTWCIAPPPSLAEWMHSGHHCIGGRLKRERVTEKSAF